MMANISGHHVERIIAHKRAYKFCAAFSSCTDKEWSVRSHPFDGFDLAGKIQLRVGWGVGVGHNCASINLLKVRLLFIVLVLCYLPLRPSNFLI